eukprot:jgi/Bigna1/68567/fgenesh1_pg.6_\
MLRHKGKTLTVSAEDQRALCRYQIWWLRREEKRLRARLDKQSSTKQKAKDAITSLCLSLEAEKATMQKNVDRLSYLEKKIRKDLDDAAQCVRWLRQAKLTDSQVAEMKRRNVIAVRLDKVLLARHELRHKYDQVVSLQEQLKALAKHANTKITAKYLKGRDYILQKVKHLGQVRKAEQQLRRRIATTALKDLDRMLRMSQVGSLPLDETRESLQGLKQNIRESGILQTGEEFVGLDSMNIILGSKLVSWLVKTQISANRTQAMRLGSIMLQWGLLFDVNSLSATTFRDEDKAYYKFRSDTPKVVVGVEEIKGWLLRVGRWRSSNYYYRWNSTKMLLRSFVTQELRDMSEAIELSMNTFFWDLLELSVQKTSGQMTRGRPSKFLTRLCVELFVSAEVQKPSSQKWRNARHITMIPVDHHCMTFCFELTDPEGGSLTLGAKTMKERGFWLQALWASGCTMHKNVLRQPKPKKREVLRSSVLEVLVQRPLSMPSSPSSPLIPPTSKEGREGGRSNPHQKLEEGGGLFSPSGSTSVHTTAAVTTTKKSGDKDKQEGKHEREDEASRRIITSERSRNRRQFGEVESGECCYIPHLCEVTRAATRSSPRMKSSGGKEDNKQKLSSQQQQQQQQQQARLGRRSDWNKSGGGGGPLVLCLRKRYGVGVKEVTITNAKIKSTNPILLRIVVAPSSGEVVTLRAPNYEEYEDWIHTFKICSAPPNILETLQALEEAFGEQSETHQRSTTSTTATTTATTTSSSTTTRNNKDDHGKNEVPVTESRTSVNAVAESPSSLSSSSSSSSSAEAGPASPNDKGNNDGDESGDRNRDDAAAAAMRVGQEEPHENHRNTITTTTTTTTTATATTTKGDADGDGDDNYDATSSSAKPNKKASGRLESDDENSNNNSEDVKRQFDKGENDHHVELGEDGEEDIAANPRAFLSDRFLLHHASMRVELAVCMEKEKRTLSGVKRGSSSSTKKKKKTEEADMLLSPSPSPSSSFGQSQQQQQQRGFADTEKEEEDDESIFKRGEGGMAVEWGPGDIALHVPQLAKDVFNPLGRLCKRFKERFAELYHHPAEHEIRLLNCCPPFPTHRDNNGDVDDNSGVEEEEGGGQGLRRRMTETLRVPEMRARMMEAARDLAYFVKMASIIAIPELYGLAFSQGARLASAQLKRSVEQRFSSGLRVVFARIHRLTDERLAEYLSTPSTHRAQLNLKALGVSKYLQLDGDDEGGGGDAIVSAAGIAKKMGGGGAGGRRRRKSGTAATAAAAAISQPKLRSGRRPKSGSIDEQQGGRTAKSAESNAADASASFRAYTPPPRPGMKDDDDVDSHHDDDPSWVNKPHHVDNDELFKGLNTAWTPAQVLRLLSMSARRLCECVDAHSTKKSVIGADDVLLLFVFMIAKAQVPDIHARVDMADIFMNSLQRSSVDGYYLGRITNTLYLSIVFDHGADDQGYHTGSAGPTSEQNE